MHGYYSFLNGLDASRIVKNLFLLFFVSTVLIMVAELIFKYSTMPTSECHEINSP